MNNLRDVIIKEVENFFADYVVKLQENLTYFNNDLHSTLKECDELLKDELLMTIEKGGFFDFDKFYIEFEKRKDDTREFGNFLKAYLAGEKQKKIHKIVNENIAEYDWIFEDEFSLEDSMRPYILNIEKLEHLYKPVSNDPYSILNGFSASVSYLMDSNLQRVKHFMDTNSEFMTEYRKTNHMIGKPYHLNMESPTKSRAIIDTPSKGGKTISSKKDRSSMKMQKSPSGGNINKLGGKALCNLMGNLAISKAKQFVMDNLTFTNAEALAYDCRKFANAHINEVNISLTGNNLSQTSLTNLKILLDGFASCKCLKFNISATRVSRELSKSIGKSLQSLKTLEHLQLNISRCTFDDDGVADIFNPLTKNS